MTKEECFKEIRAELERVFDAFKPCPKEWSIQIKLTTPEGNTITPSGLNIDLKTTVMNVTQSSLPLPASPLDERNAMLIVNLSDVDTIYIGKSDVIAGRVIGDKGGWEIPPGETLKYTNKSRGQKFSDK